MEAISALGRFEDQRAVDILMAAYRNAHGRKETDPQPPRTAHATATDPSAGRLPTRSLPSTSLSAPTGFPADWVTSIRCRAVDSLGRTNRPEASRFLAAIAGGAGKDIAVEGAEDRDVKLAAVRALGQCRQPESVAALAEILKAEVDNKDTAIIGRTHEGLMRLTGKKLPADPQLWSEAIQAGIVLAPEPTKLDTVMESIAFWEKR
jgi:HEAT repeat protein